MKIVGDTPVEPYHSMWGTQKLIAMRCESKNHEVALFKLPVNVPASQLACISTLKAYFLICFNMYPLILIATKSFRMTQTHTLPPVLSQMNRKKISYVKRVKITTQL